MIYFDNGATTPPYAEVIESMKEVFEKYFGNPSSLHQLGVQAEKVLNQSRERAAQLLGVHPSEIIFTSGATESNNMAIKGVALQYQSRGKHIITSSVEHPAVYDVCGQLEANGFTVTVLPVDAEGRVSVEDVQSALRDDTILVSIMHVNNEVGTIQPIEQIGQLLKSYPKVLFHVDAVQGFGKLSVTPKKWNVDLMSVSAHKFHGPRGTGLLYIRKGLELFPLFVGGGQEAGYRPGTENLAGIVGMVKAMRMTLDTLKEKPDYLFQLREKLWKGVETIEGCQINSPRDGAPHILNLSLPGLKSEVVLHTLEQKGVFVSTKSACSSKLDKPSRVLTSMGFDEKRARSGLRISLSYLNTESEVMEFLRVMNEVTPQLRTMLNVH